MVYKLFFSLTFVVCISTHILQGTPLLVMLDPAGDATHAGRAIEDTFERGLTLQCAHYLQTHLQENIPDVTVILSDSVGKKSTHIEHAQLANRLQVNVYISLHVYYDEDTLTMHIYHFLADPTELWKQPQTPTLRMVPYDQAHKQLAPTTNALAHQLRTLLNQQSPRQFFVPAPIGFPFKPLMGIQAPALGIEMSVQSKEQWQTYAEKLTDALTTLLIKMLNEKHSS